IGFALDINLVLPLMNTIHSLLENNKSICNIYLILDDKNTLKSVEDNNIKYLLDLHKNYNIFMKIMTDLDKEWFSLYSRSENRKDINTINYAQLLFGEYFPDINLILYLESDQIITGSIVQLYQQNLENK